MRFELRAITSEGRIESLECQAVDAQAARTQIEGRGYTVLAVRARHDLAMLWRRGETFPLPLFSQELLVLLNAGLPLVEAIETLAQKERRDDFRGVLNRVVESLRRGQPLSSALGEAPAAFPPLYVATVKAAERTSDLAPALSRYVAYEAQIEAVRKCGVSASMYAAVISRRGRLVTLCV